MAFKTCGVCRANECDPHKKVTGKFIRYGAWFANYVSGQYLPDNAKDEESRQGNGKDTQPPVDAFDQFIHFAFLLVNDCILQKLVYQ
ncbi:hypothetical protein TUMSATVNIG1_55240 [Vibrio nigripulchritudo]|nr:hypothetical protein TUMSATVNIG1_55240 [Vibrio nigripulchritudo]